MERPDSAKLLPVREQMKAWSAVPSAELRDWRLITPKFFFGFTALHRGKAMFGLRPRTRNAFTGNTVAFRSHRAHRTALARMKQDPRSNAFDKDGTRRFTFAPSGDGDLRRRSSITGRALSEAARAPGKGN